MVIIERLKAHIKTRGSVGLLLAVGLTLTACGGRSADAAELAPAATATPWPTIAAVVPRGTITATVDVPVDDTPTPERVGPELVDQFRTAVNSEALAVFPLEGDVAHPVRIETIVLSGELDPVVVINNADGDRLADSNTGGEGEPEVIGQFIFPTDGYYELGITSTQGEGEVGVSIYRLDPADLEGGGTFDSMDATLHGSIEHPSTYHTFRLPVERGQRFDVGAEALTEGLDLLFELYDPSGVLVASRDDNMDIDPWLWNYMPDQTGMYTLVLNNYGETTGSYALHVTPSESAGEAVLGTRTDLALQGVPRRSSWMSFEATALDAAYIEARPVDPGVDVQIDIYDAAGNPVISVDQTGTGEEEAATLVQFPFNGVYQVEFTTLNEGGQIEYYINYYRQAALDDETGGPIVAGGFGKSGEIEGPGTVITYVFDGTAGDVIGVDAHSTGSSALDLGFDLYAPDGTRLTRQDDVVGKNPILDAIELPQTGRYALSLWNYGDTTGTYDVYVTNPGAPSTPPPSDPVDAESGDEADSGEGEP